MKSRRFLPDLLRSALLLAVTAALLCKALLPTPLHGQPELAVAAAQSAAASQPAGGTPDPQRQTHEDCPFCQLVGHAFPVEPTLPAPILQAALDAASRPLPAPASRLQIVRALPPSRAPPLTA